MASLKQFKEVTSQMGLFHGMRFIFNCINVKLHGYAMTDDVFHWRSSIYLKKIIKRSKYNGEDLIPAKQNIPQNNCWILWLQGIENAPEIVQACYESVNKNLTNYNIILLTEENLFDYVTLPEFIMKKYKTKKIQYAHFSDIVRTYLLYFYGGLWLDATIFLTENIPQKIKDASIFFFKSSVVNKPFLPMQNFFIAANEPKNYCLEQILKILLKYWNKQSIIIDYFIYNIIIKILIEGDSKFSNLWQHIPYYCDSEVHFLQRNLGEKFEQEIFDHIKELSFCHKLTYKLPDSIKSDSSNIYNHIINVS